MATIWQNPKALEASVNPAAMFIHFYNQSRFILDLTSDEIDRLERVGSQRFDAKIFKQDKHSSQSARTIEVAASQFMNISCHPVKSR